MKLKYEIFLQWVTKFLFRKFWGYDAVIATFKDLLNMAFTEKRLNKTDKKKVGYMFCAMYQCILTAPL